MLAVNIERRPISLSDLRQIGVLTEKPVVTIMEAMHQGKRSSGVRGVQGVGARSQNSGARRQAKPPLRVIVVISM
jgi:hypothetical protein